MPFNDEWETATSIDGAIFTVQLGALVDNGFDLQLTEYPIFDETYREQLNQKIMNHYWFREIGFETPGMFRFMLKRKLNEIMPFYNQMYESTLYTIDPFTNYDMSTTAKTTGERTESRDNLHNESTTGESSTTSDSTAEGRTVVSNTPQMQLSGRDDYASNLTDTTSHSASDGTATESTSRELTETDKASAKSVDDYIQRVTGISGVLQADAINILRQSFVNADMMVIEALAPLFMGLYTDYANYL